MSDRKGAQEASKERIVRSSRPKGNRFRIVSIESRETEPGQAEMFLANLPFAFTVTRLRNRQHINRTLDVYVKGGLIHIYPPKGFMIAAVDPDAWGAADIVSQMHFSCLSQVNPISGQISSIVAINPKLLGITPNQHVAEGGEIELTIFVYPRT